MSAPPVRVRPSVHPRVCGELTIPCSATSRSIGSSPRVRGTPERPAHHVRRARFIPACAGNSASATWRIGEDTVHPRVCGELPSPAPARGYQGGSSPRVRGTHWRGRSAATPRRFIPACAGNSSRSALHFAGLAVHPRVCGELAARIAIQSWASGSSPRVRGTLGPPLAGPAPDRFIPACAGNSMRRSRSRSGRSVHPRVCGELGGVDLVADAEHGSSPRVRGTLVGDAQRCVRAAVHPRVCGELVVAPRRHASGVGSSPRVRGTLHAAPSAALVIRFIPACAGNSSSACMLSAMDTVHPRVCGELPSLSMPPSRSIGSSPRVRGTRCRRRGPSRRLRFIPACAGNSPPVALVAPNRPVHPRVCGELSAPLHGSASVHGSSPRVRGTQYDSPGEGTGRRFIPACAGNSPRVAGSGRSAAVHPRVCGELTVTLSLTATAAGSSPRVRGTPGHQHRCGGRGRFIPACAGNSRGTRRRLPGRSVHPRVCGELAILAPGPNWPGGSSPRVRGTRRRCPVAVGYGRFIPACAGNSHTAAASEAHAGGSSPRVRGTLRVGRRAFQPPRFIPACAGNSALHATGSTAAPVHPRVCGELVPCRCHRRQLRRFIPACAGNSRGAGCRQRRTPVHPRVCGELPEMLAGSRSQTGSSPRVRGTRQDSSRPPSWSTVHPRVCGELAIVQGAGRSQDGSSPRVRGTRNCALPCLSTWTVHPRVCGELTAIEGLRALVNGSSPRVRGTPQRGRALLGHRRFIPACAGNSAGRTRGRGRRLVHPRVCGELHDNSIRSILGIGSSPRVRGTRWPPARGSAVRTVHPRVCGELPVMVWLLAVLAGSSPRVRGTPRVQGVA